MATLALLLIYFIQNYLTELITALLFTSPSVECKKITVIIPFLLPSQDAPLYCNLLIILGWILDLGILLLAGLGIVQAALTRLQTDHHLSMQEILMNIKRYRFTTLFSMTGFGIIMLFFGGMLSLIFLTKAIPMIGNVLFVLLSPLTLAFGLFLLTTIVVILLALWYIPGIVILWKGDAFSTIVQAYSIVLSRPLKMIRETLLNLTGTLLAIVLPGALLVVLLFGLYLLLSRDWLLGLRFAIAAQAGILNVIPFASKLSFEPTLYSQIITLLLNLLALTLFGYAFAGLLIAHSLSFAKLKLEANDINLLEE